MPPIELQAFRAIASNSRINDRQVIGSKSVPNGGSASTVMRLTQVNVGDQDVKVSTNRAKQDLISALRQEYGDSIANKVENDLSLGNLKLENKALTKRLITQVFTVVDRELKAAFDLAAKGAEATHDPTPASTVLDKLEAWARDVKSTTGEGTAMVSSEADDIANPGSKYASTGVKTFFFRGGTFNDGCTKMRQTLFTCIERQLNDLGYSLVGKEGKMKPPSQVVKAFKLDDFKLDADGVPRSDRPVTARRVLAITEALHELRASQMTLQRNGEEFTVPAHVFLGSVKAARALPENAGKSIEEVAQTVQITIQNRMANGRSVVSLVRNDGYRAADQRQYKQDLADATLYLQLRARQLGEAFDRGALSIEDPGDKLFNFFRGQQDTVRRSSTHLKQIRGKGLTGIDEKHFGNGFVRNDCRHGLPGGMGAIVFGKIPPLTTDSNPNPPNRLWLKTETYHVTGADAETVNHLGRLLTKEKDGVKHGEELKGLTDENGRPFDLMGDLKTLVKQLSAADTTSYSQKMATAHNDCLQILKEGIRYCSAPENKPVFEKESVRSVYRTLNASISLIAKKLNVTVANLADSSGTDSDFMRLKALRDKIANALNNRRGGIENRIGDEVLLQDSDL